MRSEDREAIGPEVKSKQVKSKCGRSRYDRPGRPRAWRVLLMLQLEQTKDYSLGGSSEQRGYRVRAGRWEYVFQKPRKGRKTDRLIAFSSFKRSPKK